MVRVGDRAPNAHAARGEAAMQSQQRLFARASSASVFSRLAPTFHAPAHSPLASVVTARDAGTAAMISSSAASTLDTAASTSSSSATYRVASIAVASNSTSRSRNRRYAFCASTPAVSSSLTQRPREEERRLLDVVEGREEEFVVELAELEVDRESSKGLEGCAALLLDLRKRGRGRADHDVSLRHTRVF